MLTCKQVIDLASNSLDTKIPWPKSWQMKLHMILCKTCNHYLKQIKFIQQAVASIDAQYQNISLSSDAHLRISARLKQAQKNLEKYIH